MVKIPEGWIEGILSDIVFIQPGFAFKSKDFDVNEGEYVIKIKNIHPPFVEIYENDIVNIDGYDFEKLKKFQIKKGDYLIAMTGETIGKVGKYTSEKVSYLNQRVCKLTDIGKANYQYISYILQQESFQKFIDTHSFGAAQANISTTEIGNFQIVYPENPQEQKAIAGVLSSFDDKIELLRAENQTLEEMGQTLFKEGFISPLAPGRGNGTAKNTSDPKKEKSPSGDLGAELPDGWKWGELGEIGEQITERVKNEKERVVLSAVNSGNLVLSESYFSKQVFSEDIAKYIICDKGDFAYNPARINIGSIGRNFYWNGAVSPVYVVFRPKEKFGKYLEYIFKSERFKNHVEKYANGSVRQALNYDGFSRFELLIPNNDILEKFNENLEVFEKKIEENKKQINTLISTRDQLLPKLMSGEVRVEF